jgi:hypothetical protein
MHGSRINLPALFKPFPVVWQAQGRVLARMLTRLSGAGRLAWSSSAVGLCRCVATMTHLLTQPGDRLLNATRPLRNAHRTKRHLDDSEGAKHHLAR